MATENTIIGKEITYYREKQLRIGKILDKVMSDETFRNFVDCTPPKAPITQYLVSEFIPGEPRNKIILLVPPTYVKSVS